MKFDFLIRVHIYIHEYIRFADTKAAAILAACSVIFAGLINRFDKISEIAAIIKFPCLLLVLGLVLVSSLGFSIFHCIKCIIPRLNSYGSGLIYWDQIIQNTHYVEEIASLTEERALSELAEHIQVVSKIARQKYIHVRYGLIGLAIALIALLFLIVILLFTTYFNFLTIIHI